MNLLPYVRSYSHGASDVSLLGNTIGRAFDHAVEIEGDRDALVSCPQDVRWSYDELKRQVDKFAAGLLALGLGPGDRVGIWSPNNAEWIVSQYSTAKAGIILVNINPAYRVAELEYALNKVECKALICAKQFKTSKYIQMLHELIPELSTCDAGDVKSERVPSLKTLISIGSEAESGFYRFQDVPTFATESESEKLNALAETLQFDDPINIQFTSGTTGAPKGATLSHHNVLNNGYFTCLALAFSRNDRLCIPVPLYHCFGMVMGSLGCMIHGATMVLPSEGFEPEATLQAIDTEQCTALYGVPTMFVAMLNHSKFNQFNLDSLHTGIMAGSPCPIEVMRRIITEMNMRDVTIAYGMTETSPVSCQTSIDDDVERRVTTVGKAHPHVEIKIVDPEGHIVFPGVVGELCTRGYSVMLGYWNDKERTEEAIDNAGWIHTGDLATMDQDGYCNIAGRIKDMVIRGGENVYPREIEEYFYKHPKVEAVQVFGVPDEKYGEELCAWIKIREGEMLTEFEVRKFCEGQIAHYKIPKYLRFVDSFPMTVTGKVQKFVMREEMARDLGLAEVKSA